MNIVFGPNGVAILLFEGYCPCAPEISTVYLECDDFGVDYYLSSNYSDEIVGNNSLPFGFEFAVLF